MGLTDTSVIFTETIDEVNFGDLAEGDKFVMAGDGSSEVCVKTGETSYTAFVAGEHKAVAEEDTKVIPKDVKVEVSDVA